MLFCNVIEGGLHFVHRGMAYILSIEGWPIFCPSRGDLHFVLRGVACVSSIVRFYSFPTESVKLCFQQLYAHPYAGADDLKRSDKEQNLSAYLWYLREDMRWVRTDNLRQIFNVVDPFTRFTNFVPSLIYIENYWTRKRHLSVCEQTHHEGRLVLGIINLHPTFKSTFDMNPRQLTFLFVECRLSYWLKMFSSRNWSSQGDLNSFIFIYWTTIRHNYRLLISMGKK